MPALAELQQQFAGALLRGEDGMIACCVAGHGRLTPQRRLAVYRNHLFTSLTDALAASFPVLRTLVDARFFAYAAHAFIATEPPTDACVNRFGAGLPDFLASFEPCRELPWLADVARFEWAQLAALANPLLPPAAPATLAGAVGLSLQPSLRRFGSRWPVDLIWQANQGPAAGETPVDLAAGGVELLLWRDGDDVLFRRLEAGEAALLDGLLDSRPLTDATEAALAADPMFDLLLSLRRLLADRLIVDAHPATPDPETDR